MYRNLCAAAFFVLMLLTLAACDVAPLTPSPALQEAASGVLATPALTDISCASCAQSTLEAALIQQKNSANNQLAATADVVNANAQATLNSANATLGAAMTQSQDNANFIAAQIAATAEVSRANAQATVNSASITLSAAQTQSQYDLQATQVMGTQVAIAIITQQNKNELVAGTQTAIADTIVTQTQSAVATSQWYTDQERQRAEQRQGPIAFLWMWCLPMFVVLLAGLALWGFWRWLKIQQANQLILENPINKLPALTAEVAHQHDDALPYIESDVIDSSDYQVTKPDDQVSQWLDEVKDQLQNSDEKDKKDDDTNN